MNTEIMMFYSQCIYSLIISSENWACLTELKADIAYLREAIICFCCMNGNMNTQV